MRSRRFWRNSLTALCLLAKYFPATFKASITPAIKKPAGLDAMNVHRIDLSPIFLWCQSFLSGLWRTNSTATCSPRADFLPSLQSGFRPGHSTETVVLRSYLICWRQRTMETYLLCPLPLIPSTMVFCVGGTLQVTFGLDGPVLAWFRSYLRGRTQSVRRGLLVSSLVQLLCGVLRAAGLSPRPYFIHYVHC